MFTLILGLVAVAILAGIGALAHRFFSARQRIEIPPLRDKDVGPREPLSILLSVVSCAAIFSAIPVAHYRRHTDLYATELRIVGVVMVIGLMAALVNRWMGT